MADEQAHQHTVLGELSPPGPGELTVMRRLDVQGNPEAYELKVLKALDSSLLRRKLIDYHDGGLSLVSRLKAKFGRSLVAEVAVIRLGECCGLNNRCSESRLEIIDRDGTKSDVANENCLQLMVQRITKYENCARYLDGKADLARARMVLLISEESRFKKLRAKAGKQLGKSKDTIQREEQLAQ